MRLKFCIWLLTLAVFAVLTTPNIYAQNKLVYSAYTGEQSLENFGTTRKENYDIAIHISNPDLVGTVINGIRIPINSIEGISNLTAWLSESLNVVVSKNAPDILSQNADIEAGFVEVIFTSPYTITTNGVYAGYSFDMDELTEDNSKPIVGINGSEQEMSYLRSSRTYRNWNTRAESLKFNSAMQVLITDCANNAATGLLPTKNTQVNTTEEYVFEIQNRGSNGISSIDFNWKIAGFEGNEHKEISISPHYNKQGLIKFNLPMINSPGTYPLSINITKVNEMNNEIEFNATTDVVVYSILPVHRPLVEEYTGTTCGYCPRGIVGLENMHRMFGDDFIAVSYHQYSEKDPMDFGFVFSNIIAGYPDAWINRTISADPYFGLNTSGFHFDKIWKVVRDTFTPLSIDLSASFTDAEQNEINIHTATSAAYDLQGKYRLTYFLTADSLTGEGPEWKQANYISGKKAAYPDEDMSMFVEAEREVSGIIYNDVAIAWSEEDIVYDETNRRNIHNSGIAGSLPDNFIAGIPVEHTYTFNISGNKVIQNKSKLTAIAAIIDTETKEIINANKTRVRTDTSNSINDIKSFNPLTIRKRYYTIDGRQVSHPQSGINIVRTSDGKSFKLLIR